MTTATTATFQRIHDAWQALVLDSIQAWKRPVSVPYLAPLTDGRSQVVWDMSDGPRGWDNQAVTHLLPALLAQANRYRRMGLDISAADCCWLAQQLKSGAMTIVGSYMLPAE